MSALAYAVAAWLFVAGVLGIIISRHALHMIGCLVVTQASTYVLLVAIGYRAHGEPPIVPTGEHHLRAAVDPVVQAMALTDIVVGVAVISLLVGLAMKAYQRFGTMDPERFRSMSG